MCGVHFVWARSKGWCCGLIFYFSCDGARSSFESARA
jgi:hypothetical protein